MDAIKYMNVEHENILRFVKVARKMAQNILENKKIDFNDFELAVSFIKEYADKFHHQKEEDILFNKMVENLGDVAVKVINHGMIVEHDFGRLYVSDMIDSLNKLKQNQDEHKLDLIASIISYTKLIERHIEKEDKVIYNFAKRELKKEIMDIVNLESMEIEKNNIELIKRNLEILEKLEQKYLS